MAGTKDPLLRCLALLQLIPRAPARSSTTTLLAKLKDRGYDIDLRSLQRDLSRLAGEFPITCHDDERPFQWSFDRSANLDLPRQDTPTALALYLAESHLRHLMPQGVMQQLAPQFRAAREHLQGLEHNHLAQWPQRVRAIPNGQALLPADIAPEVWMAVSEALVGQRQLRVNYLSRSKGEHKTLRLHPLSLVSRHAVSYLVSMADDYEDLRHFALHRIQRAEVLDVPARQSSDHDIDGYIAAGAFGMRRSEADVELLADVHPQTAWMLRETPLSLTQELTLLPDHADGWYRLRVRLPDSQETIWWILGLNSRIRVLEPVFWVNDVLANLGMVLDLYNLKINDVGCF
jgi:predicted DNA-binding transcriptional regulator YafY